MKNCFDRTPHTMKDWLLLAAGVAAVFAAADWLPGVLRGAGAFLGLLAPFGWGLLLAYVLDIPTRFFAQKLFGGRRGGALAVSYALFFGALALLAATGCDGVAVGRGAMGNPWLFGQIAAAMECREVPPPPSLHERFRVLRRHIRDMCGDKGEYIAMQQARTHAAWYMHGLRGAATLRRECCGMLHFTDLDRVIEHAWELQRETR